MCSYKRFYDKSFGKILKIKKTKLDVIKNIPPDPYPKKCTFIFFLIFLLLSNLKNKTSFLLILITLERKKMN